ncbi:MAG: ATP-binding cassette domain-containing protein [Pseudomonadota bacterium]
MLQLESLTLSRGGRPLFEGASLQIPPGRRAGVTGANGSGKTSLFALILGELHPDQGDLRYPTSWVVAQVAQETPALTMAALEYVIEGDGELARLRQALAETSEDGVQQAHLHIELEAIDGYRAESRAAKLMMGLGFVPGDENRPVAAFSGGFRVRLNLARALMCRSDLLLLDEPTNHLDLDAILWLEDWLRTYPGTLLMVSHDRDFLDAVVEVVAHIEDRRLQLYTGNYSAFERQRAEQLSQHQAAFERQQREILRIRSFVDRFRAKATKARQAQSRLKVLERMEVIAAAHADSPFGFRFREPERLPNPLLRIDQAAVGYGDTPVLSGIGLLLDPDDRIGLLGRNGAGKSTLVKLLAGAMMPSTGHYEPAQALKVGYFAQHQLEQLDPDRSPMGHLLRLDPQANEQSLRGFLGGFGFSGEQALASCCVFSGGEKARLALALIIYQRPNLLLLDEPTNHLDLEMRHALGEALQEFSGAMVIVSHDRHLLRLTCDRLLLVHGGRVMPFDGDLDDYPAWLAAQRAESVSASGEGNVGDHSALARKDRRRVEAERRATLQPWRDRLKQLEKNLAVLGQRREALEAAFADPALYAAGNGQQFTALSTERAELTRRIDTIETEWLTVAERLETQA